MSAIGELTDAQASLRLLIILYQAKRTLNQEELFKQLRTTYKLGRYTMNTAIDACIKLGLIISEPKRSAETRWIANSTV